MMWKDVQEDTAKWIRQAAGSFLYSRNAKLYRIPLDHQVATAECLRASYCKIRFGNLHFTCFLPEIALHVFMNTSLTLGFSNSFGGVLSEQLLPTMVEVGRQHGGHLEVCNGQMQGLLGLICM